MIAYKEYNPRCCFFRQHIFLSCILFSSQDSCSLLLASLRKQNRHVYFNRHWITTCYLFYKDAHSHRCCAFNERESFFCFLLLPKNWDLNTEQRQMSDNLTLSKHNKYDYTPGWTTERTFAWTDSIVSKLDICAHDTSPQQPQLWRTFSRRTSSDW